MAKSETHCVRYCGGQSDARGTSRDWRWNEGTVRRRTWRDLGGEVTPLRSQSPHSSAPMWRKSLYLKGGTTGAMWVKQHLTRSYDRGHLRPKGMRGQEHDAKRLMRLSTNRQEVS